MRNILMNEECIARLVRYIVATEKARIDNSQHGFTAAWKVPSIKALRECIPFSLTEAKDLVEAVDQPTVDPVIALLRSFPRNV